MVLRVLGKEGDYLQAPTKITETIHSLFNIFKKVLKNKVKTEFRGGEAEVVKIYKNSSQILQSKKMYIYRQVSKSTIYNISNNS